MEMCPVAYQVRVVDFIGRDVDDGFAHLRHIRIFVDVKVLLGCLDLGCASEVMASFISVYNTASINPFTRISSKPPAGRH